jgi:membrane associated rhomboid family serine protease
MTAASVGYQCPEEVAAARREAPAMKTSTGGRVGILTGRITPTLIVLCVLGWLAQGAPITQAHSVNSFTVHYSLLGPGLMQGEYYRLVTAAFLHVSITHLLFNMWVLYVIGIQVERALGWVRYTALYFLAAIGGNVLVYLVSGATSFEVGASTAIFGLLAAYYIVARKARADTTQIVFLIAINLFISVAFSNISLWGHVGGLVTGALAAAILVYVPARQALLQGAALAGMAVVLVAAAVVQTALLT